ncbi:CapA family protein [Desulfosporosinus hippei]|uniref:Poly-gamma-glutamate synthesis protein (Capsule biosynthesis protein) n=1 Tax=Desulfosporosinus hippei DSM 8344 TaxID=1121419 RepID=A0A1G8J0X2_9FIRM|nr:CapA family protein [Desulfosporosinus hippei]SDI24627.1 poly-gamma-glutamate synthesis protein (capsule biosynthesis protein) [Desulfosporosinus hippei DSM 8344]
MVFLCLVLLGCGAQSVVGPVSNQTPKQSADEIPKLSHSVEPKTSVRKSVTLVATGDILMHNTQIWSGQQANGSYNFDHFFSSVKPLLEYGDYTSANFEAAMAGGESGYTGYPKFNSPDEVAATLKSAGYDLIVTSNNHILDRGYSGAIRTMRVLRNAGLDIVGTYQSQEERDTYFIKDLDGVRVGYLAYSYGTNGIPVPKEQPYFFNFLNKEIILKDIAQLSPKVDVLVLVLHWGIEYSLQPTEEQRELARLFLENGADVILGSHPHVIQPMEIMNINNQDKLVVYSMGNFIGDQHGVERNSGVILNITFQKDQTKGETLLKEVSYTPTYSHSYFENKRRQFRVISVEDAIRKIQEGKDPYLKSSDLAVLKQVLAQTQKQLGMPYKQDI